MSGETPPNEPEMQSEEPAEDDMAPAFVEEGADDIQVVADLDEDDMAPPDSDEEEEDIAASTAGTSVEGGPSGMEADVPSEENAALLISTEHTDAVVAVACSPANSTDFATGGCDDAAFLYKMGVGGAEPSFTKFPLRGHTDTVAALGFSSDGSYLATGGLDGRVLVWDAASGAQKVALEGPGEGIEFISWHPRGPVVLAGSEDFTAWMWNGLNGACMQVFTGHSGPVRCGGFTPDGKTVVTGAEDASLRVWDPRSGESKFTIQGYPYHEGPINCLQIHSDGNLVITGSEDKTARLVHIHNGRVLGTLSGHLEGVECVSLSSTQPLAASGGVDGNLFLWDLQNMEVRSTLVHDDSVIRMCWHPTEPLLYSACLDGKVRKWDSRTGACVQVYGGHTDALQDLVISCDGGWLMTGSDDNTVRLFAA